MSHPVVHKTHLLWPGIILLLLIANTAGGIALVLLSNDGPSLAVEPNYYQKGLAWDDQMAQQRENQRLGWRPKLTVVETALRFSLRDRSGDTVQGANVTVKAFFNARPDLAQRRTLAEQAPGEYATSIPFFHSGQWVFEVQAERGKDRFQTKLRQQVLAAQ